MPAKAARLEYIALLALLGGALAIGTSGIFVKLSETGPTATAFWRGLLALPVLAAWALLERRGGTTAAGPVRTLLQSWRDPAVLWAGVFFAGDLALWHWSLVLIPVAVSTLEANCAPIVVTLCAWALWGERPRLGFVLALALAFAGMLLILGAKLSHGVALLGGDLLGFGTACFYGFYLLAVARLRARYSTSALMLSTTVIFTLLLLPIALTQQFLPRTLHGWLLLLGCALLAQALGQSLIAYALAHLPATFGSVALYVQVVASALYAWLLLGERLTPLQIAGGAIVLGAIALARVAGRPPARAPAPAARALEADVRGDQGA
jgi:drug/metabolite transporter (DMT)-like permease